MATAVPFTESHRLRRLKTFGILDTPAEEHFDSITRVAASLLQVPIALLNFIDETREWCKSTWGMARRSAKREESLCAQALLTNDIPVIPDATAMKNLGITLKWSVSATSLSMWGGIESVGQHGPRDAVRNCS